MEKELLRALEKAEAPWWVYLVALAVIAAIGLLKLKSGAHSVHRRMKLYMLERAKKLEEAATSANAARDARLKAEALQEDIDVIDQTIGDIRTRAETARANVRAATSFSDLQP